MNEIVMQLRNLKHLWDAVDVIEETVNEWEKTRWSEINLERVDQECRQFLKYFRTLDKSSHQLEPFKHCEMTLRQLMVSLRTLMNLQEKSMRERHWKELRDITGEDIKIIPETTLKTLLDYQLHKFEESIKEIVEKSAQEQSIEMGLGMIKSFWHKHNLEYEENLKMKIMLPKWSEEMFVMLDDHHMQLQNIVHSRYVGEMAKEADIWRRKLDSVGRILNVWFDVQRKWLYMESIFLGSRDIQEKIPEESQRFIAIDKKLRGLVEKIQKTPLTIRIISHGNLLKELRGIEEQLIAIERVLNEYLEGKRMDFPRFYFISSVDLLDILTCGSQPREVFRHLTKLFDSIKSLQMGQDEESLEALGMFSKEDEYVTFQKSFKCPEAVEVWLNYLITEMRMTLRHVLGQAVAGYSEKERHEWILDWPAQLALCATQIWWATEVERAFRQMEEGNENAMKNYQKRQKEQLSELINMLIGELTVAERQKIMTICTIDVHSRDVVAKLIGEHIESSMAFQWQSQLRHRWDDDDNDCFANICDANFPYDYEYLGNTPRLVVTPLTDKCYITLTQVSN
uniref:Dynein heavy chain linker domain-containing protein n=1 Tax=Phlebotomus papatasi TaxID=29031 RepID=A0A1B0DMV2_PHLPP